MKVFKLPDLGEGLQEAELIEWNVEKGDTVKTDQVVVVVETAKAVVELPSPCDGVIAKLCASPGDTVHVGEVLIEYAGVGTDSVSVVGKLSDASELKTEAQTESFVLAEAASVGAAKRKVVELQNSVSGSGAKQLANQAPAEVMEFADRLGLSDLLPDYAYGSLTRSELARIYEQRKAALADSPSPTPNAGANVVALTGAAKVMAQTMAKSHQLVPAVTLFDDANVSHWDKQEDISVRLVSALVAACKAVPVLNAWFDDENLSIQLFSDINIGIAVNSDHGLYVPVLRDAAALSAEACRQLIDKLVAEVNERSIKPQKLLGATISLSNFGTLSGRYATPIIVPPQVAIVGIGAVRKQPWVVDGKIKVQNIMPISLSFDHRAATGAEAASFLAAFIASLTQG